VLQAATSASSSSSAAAVSTKRSKIISLAALINEVSIAPIAVHHIIVHRFVDDDCGGYIIGTTAGM
jgi:hypothetical protein